MSLRVILICFCWVAWCAATYHNANMYVNAHGERIVKVQGANHIDIYHAHKTAVGCIGYAMHPVEGYGRILSLWVAESYRRRGVGQRLLQYAVSDLYQEGAYAIDLYTRSDNYTARRLYERCGFYRFASDDFCGDRYRLDCSQ